MRLTERQLGTIVNALRIAAQQYESDARTVRADAPGHRRIAEQFDLQAREAMALADRIEYGDADIADDEATDARSRRHYPSLEGEAA